MAQKKRSEQWSIKALRKQEVKLRGKDLWNKLVLSREWKREEVMDEQTGVSKEQEVISEGIGESEMKELVPEWG